jgi:hypothetical protein
METMILVRQQDFENLARDVSEMKRLLLESQHTQSLEVKVNEGPYSLKKAMKYIGVGETTMRKLVKDSKIHYIRKNPDSYQGHMLFRKCDLDKFLAAGSEDKRSPKYR